MPVYDVALWQSWPALWPSWVGQVEAPHPFLAVCVLMHTYKLPRVGKAAVNCGNGSIARWYGFVLPEQESEVSD